MTNIVENPNIILCSFNKQFLDIPKEIITITIENYQKYFPLYDQKNNKVELYELKSILVLFFYTKDNTPGCT